MTMEEENVSRGPDLQAPKERARDLPDSGEKERALRSTDDVLAKWRDVD